MPGKRRDDIKRTANDVAEEIARDPVRMARLEEAFDYIRSGGPGVTREELKRRRAAVP